MTTILVASWRLQFPILVDGIIHTHHLYLKAQPSTLNPPYDVLMKDGSSPQAFAVLGNAYLTAIAGAYSAADTTFGDFLLENLIGTAWIPVATGVATALAANTNPYSVASQVTVTCRDTAFNKIRILFLESAFPAGEKVIPPGATYSATLFTWLGSSPGSGSTSGFNWIVGRSNLYLGSVVSWVTDLNDKVRRRRGIA